MRDHLFKDTTQKYTPMKYARWHLLAISVLLSALALWSCEQSTPDQQAADVGRPAAAPADASASTTAKNPQPAREKEDVRRTGTLTEGLTKDPSTVDVALPMECRGQEPSWHLSLTEEAITLRRLGEPVLVFEPATFRPSGGAFLLFTRNKDGHSLSLMLVDEACTDPMDGTSYPYTVKMSVDGRSYVGCARPVR